MFIEELIFLFPMGIMVFGSMYIAKNYERKNK